MMIDFNSWFSEYNRKNGLPPAVIVAEAAYRAGVEAGRADLKNTINSKLDNLPYVSARAYLITQIVHNA